MVFFNLLKSNSQKKTVIILSSGFWFNVDWAAKLREHIDMLSYDSIITYRGGGLAYSSIIFIALLTFMLISLSMLMFPYQMVFENWQNLGGSAFISHFVCFGGCGGAKGGGGGGGGDGAWYTPGPTVDGHNHTQFSFTGPTRNIAYHCIIRSHTILDVTSYNIS